jgi:hypothetical protein
LKSPRKRRSSIPHASETTLVDRNQIDNLPINGRRYDQFALLAPGVTRDARFGLLSYHGMSGVYNNFTIEGNDDNQVLFSEARGRARIASSISANAIEEFQVCCGTHAHVNGECNSDVTFSLKLTPSTLACSRLAAARRACANPVPGLAAEPEGNTPPLPKYLPEFIKLSTNPK